MKPPTGFVPLCEAVYTVGKRLHGLNWHPIGKCSDRRLFDHEVEIVIAVIAKACEAGQITAAYRSITGADALDRSAWHRPHWQSYFANGVIDLDLPLLDNNGDPYRDGHYTERWPREIFVRQDDLNRLIATLPKPSGKQSSQVNSKHIVKIVTDYRQSLPAGANPSLNDCRQFAQKDRGLVGHRDELDNEYHQQFPGRHTPGRPSKK